MKAERLGNHRRENASAVIREPIKLGARRDGPLAEKICGQFDLGVVLAIEPDFCSEFGSSFSGAILLIIQHEIRVTCICFPRSAESDSHTDRRYNRVLRVKSADITPNANADITGCKGVCGRNCQESGRPGLGRGGVGDCSLQNKHCRQYGKNIFHKNKGDSCCAWGNINKNRG